MKRKKITFALAWSVILLGSLALDACTDGKSAVRIVPKMSDPIPVRVMPITKAGGENSIRTSGRVTTEEETTLGFKTGGVIRSVLVKEGDPVKKGQLLATLDLTEVNTLVTQARIGHEKAERDLRRATNLYRDSVATLEQLQNAETAVSLANEQLNAAGFNKTHSEIHAPADGYVLRKFASAGQVVSIGDPVLMTNSAASGSWILKVGVSDKQWADTKLHDKAEVRIDAFFDVLFDAEVSRKAETSDAASGAFTIELRIKNGKSRLASGMFGSATIHSVAQSSMWSVPFEAVLDANGNQGFVFITLDEKTAIKKPVTIESFDGKSVRISSGLEEAHSLVIAGSAYLTDSSTIRIVK